MIRPILLFCVALLFLSATSAVPLREELKVEGGTLHYRVLGKGKPVVIVGGLPGTSSEYLLPVAEKLAGTFQCIVVDLRGTGKSRFNVVDTSSIGVPQILRDLESLRVQLKHTKWIVFGHSWGGIVAMSYAARLPSRVQALVLVGSGGINLDFLQYYNPNINARMTREDSAMVAAAQAFHQTNPQLSNAEEFRAMLGAYLSDRKHLPEIKSWFSGENYSPATAQVVWRSLFSSSYDLVNPLKKYKRPALQIQGEQDPVDKKTADQIHASIKHSKVVFLKNCGHFPWLEQEEEFYKTLKEFLKAVG